MKRLVLFFLICFVAFTVSKSFAQTTSVQILANSKEITGNLTLEGTQRLTFIVHESVGGDEAPAYEFGAIQLIPNNGGATVVLKAATIESKPNSVYSLRQNLLQAYPQGFKIKMDGIKAVFENKKVPLALKASQLEINVLPQ